MLKLQTLCYHAFINFWKIIKSKLLEFLNKNDTLYKYQWLGIYLDFQKAFDTVDHEILLYKLNHYGIRGNLLEWFKSYLTDRKQFTFINGVNSQDAFVTCGVPQGSVLGPLLFLIYVNDIQHALKNATKLFADDIIFFYFTKM